MHFHKTSIKNLLLAFLILMAFQSYAQQPDSVALMQADSANIILKQLSAEGLPGKVRIIPQDQRVLDLLWHHVHYNDSVGIYGWKVLIYNGRSRTDAIAAESLFLNSFPDLNLPVRVVYPEPPDFKTLVGVYRTKEEAYKAQQVIKSVFRNCYLIYVRLEKGELE